MYSQFQNVILTYCCIGGQGQGQSNSPFLTLDWQQALRRDRLFCKVQVRHVLLDWLAVGYLSPCGLMLHLYFSSTFIRQWRDANKSYYWFWHSSVKVLGKVSSGQETRNSGRVPMKDGKSHGGSLQAAQKQDHLPKTVDELRKMFLHNAARHNAMQHSVILQIRAKKVPCRGLYLIP